MQTQPYTVLSLFSGGMGLDVGLKKTGCFDLLACVEKEPSFCATIRHNQCAGRVGDRVRIVEADIKSVDASRLRAELGLERGAVDLLVGGPPCQAFSTAGKRGTVQDPRGTLLWDYLRFVGEFQPKFFLMENVRGLMSAALNHRAIRERPEQGGASLATDELPGSVVRLFCDDLQKLTGSPYHMDCFEVNAVNYGAPQIRERALFIGNRFNAVVDFPDPTHGPSPEDDEDAMPDFFLSQAGRLAPWATLRDAIGALAETEPEILDFSPRKKAYLEMVPPGSNWRSLPVPVQQESMGAAWHAKGGRSGWWRRLTFDLPCPTLVTMPNHASTALCHPTETRALSLREYARIQEFPDDWQFCGTTSEKYAQVGNAVPVRLAQVAGSLIAGHLEKLRARSWRAYPRPVESLRKIYVQSHVRTRKWFKGGETFVWGATENSPTYAAPKTKRKIANMTA
jgi:DNA (cytosine-5)-methyltransferase 1